MRQERKNPSGLVPLGSSVLVEPFEPERTIHSKIIAIPETARDRLMMAEQHAVVIEVGPEAWKNESQPRARVGDFVMISAYAGMMTTGPKDGRRYRVVNANDVFLRITTKVKPRNTATI